jgi:asparagine synthase (glutamine-hydrolysing)
MCGIAGCIVAPGTEPPRPALERMADALSHRGPDDRGIVTSANVGLVNTRLAIVDPSPAGHQPIADASRRWLMTYNGEVFNHVALRDELSLDGWRGRSDSETLVAALAAWGEAALPRCNGFFALAALDLGGARLVLARDRFGVKPLYVARWNGGFWFASEMRALLAAGVSARPRRDVLAYAAATGWVAGWQTPIKAIDRLPPGGMVTVDTGTMAVSDRRWYEPHDAVSPEVAEDFASRSRGELAARLEETLRDAVRRRLLGDVPVGTACSGGLDSSLVTAFARDEHPSVVAFNASLVDERDGDEALWAETAAKALNVELDIVRITTADWRAALVDTVAEYEYPLSAGASAVSISLMARRAQQRGVKVLLTGEAADELFAGYPLLHGRQFRSFLPVRPFLRRVIEAARAPDGKSRVRRLLISQLSGRAAYPPPAVEPPLPVTRWRDAELASARQAYAHHRGSRAQLEASLLSWFTAGRFGFLLNRMDKDAMAHSVETRIPFLDRELVELVVNLPLEHRIGPAPKGLLRDIARERLPRPIVRRAKQPGMRVRGRRRIADAARPEFLEHGYLRDLLQLPRESWRRFLDRAGPTHLWTAEIWCRLFLDGQDVASVERDLWVSERIAGKARPHRPPRLRAHR